MNETERDTVTLLRRVKGDILTGTPVYIGEYESVSQMQRYKITIVPPSTTVEKIYRAMVKCSDMQILPDGMKIYIQGSDETFWALRIDTVNTWISRLIDADVWINNAEEYSR